MYQNGLLFGSAARHLLQCEHIDSLYQCADDFCVQFSDLCVLSDLGKEGTMTEEQKELFSRYTDCVREYQAMAECLLFQNSFRLGGRMMLEVMTKRQN